MNSRHAPDAKRIVALAAALLTLFALWAMGKSAQAALITGVTNFQPIEAPQPSSGTFAIGVSGNTVVGGFYNPATVSNGFSSTPTGSNFMPYTVSSSTTTLVSGISGNVKVGSYTDAVGSGTHGFEDNGSTVTTLNYQNNASIYTVATGVAGNDIVGYFNNGATHGFSYDGTTWTPIDEPTAGTQLTVAYGTNGSQIVGYFVAGGMLQGFWYDGSTYHTLDAPVPGVVSTAAYGISGNTIVGDYQDSNGVYHGFLYDDVHNAWSFPIDYPGTVTATKIYGISGNTIVGEYLDANGVNHGFSAQVPEPSTAILLVLGAALAAGAMCRRLK